MFGKKAYLSSVERKEMIYSSAGIPSFSYSVQFCLTLPTRSARTMYSGPGFRYLRTAMQVARNPRKARIWDAKARTSVDVSIVFPPSFRQDGFISSPRGGSVQPMAHILPAKPMEVQSNYGRCSWEFQLVSTLADVTPSNLGPLLTNYSSNTYRIRSNSCSFVLRLTPADRQQDSRSAFLRLEVRTPSCYGIFLFLQTTVCCQGCSSIINKVISTKGMRLILHRLKPPPFSALSNGHTLDQISIRFGSDRGCHTLVSRRYIFCSSRTLFCRTLVHFLGFGVGKSPVVIMPKRCRVPASLNGFDALGAKSDLINEGGELM